MANSFKTFLNISASNGSLSEIVAQIKHNDDYNEWCKITDDSSTLLRKNISWFIGNPLPKSYVEIGRIPSVTNADSLDQEFEWFFLTARRFYNEINQFINLKTQFESHILTANYVDAEACLN